eukprot:CAMPEP_0181038164 /NCGR_PEP_ID=MMETSP1070-20121207/9789_1 /TAXON_ID=265543 /ORGANISM="Minutocellus polymorphus, Strain NH13" /LENGTH=509 /DNA_ID=CAMNT_0023115929 /DNA_START=101 /DNA_END=1631 /DNA_ORIENTATION=-
MSPKMSSKRRAALALCCCLSSASAFAPTSTTTAAPSSSIVTSRRRPRSGGSGAQTQLHVSASYLFGATTGGTTTTDGQSYLPQVNHRHSAKDWIHNVASLPHSSILRDIRAPVLAVLAWSTVVSVVHRLLLTSTNPVWAGLGANLQVGPTAHSFLVSSLGLLLVFRTNSAYQRFAEGRRIWERILSESRNLSRMMNLYRRDIGDDRRSRMTQLLAAFPYLLRHHIRPKCLECNGKNIPKENRILLPEPLIEPVETRHDNDKTNGGSTDPKVLQGGLTSECWVDKRSLPWSLFPDTALAKVATAKNRPLWTCDRLGRELASVAYSDNWTSRERLTMLSKVEKLSNAIGECERIHQTAVPLNYARHSLRSLTMWLFTLPFALIRDYGLMTGPIMGGTAWLLFGVYQIGHSIEDPFQGTLRLSVLCEAIRKDVMTAGKDDRDAAYAANDDDIANEDWTSVTGVKSSITSDKSLKFESDDILFEQAKIGESKENRVVLNTPGLMNQTVDSWMP